MAGDIWAKVNYDLVEKDNSGTGIASPTFERKDWLMRWERVRPIVDLFASAFWIYAVLQVFVFDVDRAVLGLISPGAETLANYRVLIFLALLAGAALVGRRLKPQAILLYVLIFPLVVLLWKLPKTLIKTRSWLAFFAVANVVVDLLGSFRYVAIATAAWIFAAVFILATDLNALLIASMLALVAVLVSSFWRTIRFSIRPARFLSFQATTIERVVGSDRMEGIAALSEELRSEDIEIFDSEQQQAFTSKLANAVLIHRVLGFWAYQLDQYRRSSFAVLLNFVGYLGLFVQTLATLTLVNYAIYKIDSAAFTYTNPPSLIDFGRYVLASFSGSEIAAVQSHSELAGAVSIVSALIGIVFLLGLGLTLLVSIRQGHQDEAAKETIGRIHRQGDMLENKLRGEYGVSMEEAVERLKELRYALMGLITYFSQQTTRYGPGE
ncbi:MAG TPA: hypothetical protein VN758_14770 [Solirubrobacterales bacterium]|nr:hypothetical protein [Solirubrobacterales bacterium]